MFFSIFLHRSHWVNASLIPVFFVTQESICPVLIRPYTTATTLI